MEWYNAQVFPWNHRDHNSGDDDDSSSIEEAQGEDDNDDDDLYINENEVSCNNTLVQLQ